MLAQSWKYAGPDHVLKLVLPVLSGDRRCVPPLLGGWRSSPHGDPGEADMPELQVPPGKPEGRARLRGGFLGG